MVNAATEKQPIPLPVDREGGSADTSALTARWTPDLLPERGRTTVADHVVAKVAALAARETPGVATLVLRQRGGAFARFFAGFSAKPRAAQEVQVDASDRDVAIDLTLTVRYGESIPTVVATVRDAVIERVQSMTGLSVRAVNIDVSDLSMSDHSAG